MKIVLLIVLLVAVVQMTNYLQVKRQANESVENSSDIENLSRPGIWMGTALFCDAKPSHCDLVDLDYIRMDKSGDGYRCLTGDKVFCQMKPLSAAAKAGINRDPNQLTVVTYNIFQRVFLNGNDGQYERASRIPRLMATNHPEADVIVLQEAFIKNVNMGFSLRSLFSYYGFPYATLTVGNTYRFSVNQPMTAQTGGVFIVSRWPIIENASKVFQNFYKYGTDQLSRKGVGYAQVKKGSQHYHIFGTHLQSQEGADYDQARILQAGEFKAFVDSLSIPSSERVIFTGDMNVDWINDPEHVTQVMTALNATIVPKSDQSLMATYDPPNNNLVEETTNQTLWLDYVMYSNSHQKPTTMFMRSVSAQVLKPFPYCASTVARQYVLPDSLLCLKKLMTRQLSDHYPVVAKLYYFEMNGTTTDSD